MTTTKLNKAQIDQANLANLMSLWQCYGVEHGKKIRQYQLNNSQHWPHRVWLSKKEDPTHSTSTPLASCQLNNSMQLLPSGSIFPVWPSDIIKESDYACLSTLNAVNQYVSQHWALHFQQTAMYLPLNHPLKLPKCNNALNIKSISTDNDIKQWVGIGSQAFGYDINFQVFQQLRRNSAIHLLLAWLDQAPVACGLLYQTDKVIGIHQVAIAPKYQGQGLAKQLMAEMINRCIELGGNYVVLQASSAGKPLYQKLGFHEQFIFDNYQLV